MDIGDTLRRTGNVIGTVAQAVVPESLQKVAAHLLSDSVIVEEAFEPGRGYNVAGAIAARLEGVEFQPLTAEQLAFRENVGDFLDPEVELDLDAQLEITTELYSQLGYTPPELDDSQKATLQKTLEANPGKRVVPTPLLNLEERIAIVDRAQDLPAQQFDTDRLADDGHLLWVPEAGLYRKLLDDPDSTYTDDRDPRITYELLYKIGDGDVTDRAGYIDWLKRTEQAVEDEYGTIWTYPVSEVQVKSDRTDTTAGDLHEAVDPLVSPELLIVTQLLHQANGTPDSKWQSDFANEAIYAFYELSEFNETELEQLDIDDEDRKLGRKLERVARIRWDVGYRYIALGGVDADKRTDKRFGIRRAISGLLQRN
jgi:hypothetical protein